MSTSGSSVQHDDEENDSFESRSLELQKECAGVSPRKALSVLVGINLMILFMRPQNDLSVLRILELPLILSLCALPIVVPRLLELWKSSLVMKSMFGMLVLGGLWIPFAHNNAYAFYTWQDVATQYLLYLFPLILIVQTGRQLRSLSIIVALMGAYLSIYAITHAGRGPGAFLGDENDLCLALLGFLGLPLFLFSHTRSQAERWLFIAAVGLMLTGVVASLSRGGFLGLVALLGYLFLRSRAKVLIIIFGVLTMLIGALFVPQEYWEEMSTIQDVQGGTANERTRTWKIAFDIWAHPPHIAFGTGMNNARAWMGEFEPKVNKSNYKRSLAGRSVHSTLFQLLADLGVAGILIVGTALLLSYRRNVKADKTMIRTVSSIKKLDGRIRDYLEQRSIVHEELQRDVAVPSIQNAREEVDFESLRKLLKFSVSHLQYLSAFSLGLNACFVGVLISGLFVSVLYYPSIWFLVALSFIVQQHAERVQRKLRAVVDSIQFREPVSG